MDLTKIRLNFEPKGVKFNGDVEDGFSVLVVDEKSKFQAWMDVFVDNKDVSADWNQYIFHLNDDKDVFQKEMQDDCYIFEMCNSAAIDFLQEINKISQDENANWSYVK
jgi:hypothetical protein